MNTDDTDAGPSVAPRSVGEQWAQYRKPDGSLVLVRWDHDIEPGWVPMPPTGTP